jgi:hypothetical protein
MLLNESYADHTTKKQLALYLDAARVLAHLAAAPNYEREKTEVDFGSYIGASWPSSNRSIWKN